MAAMAAVLAWLNASLGDTIVTKNDVFYIPFSVTSVASDQTLELHVSGDAGKTWQLYQRQPASAGKFSFRAADDGEFWFAVRVADRQANPAQPIGGPELKVALDRTQPALTAFGARTPTGQVVCRWSAEDPHLDPASISVEYQVAGQKDWTAAPTDAMPKPQILQLKQVAYGSAVLPGITLGQTIRLRVSVRDKAGNLTSTEREYNPAALPMIQDDQPPGNSPSGELASRPLPSVEHALPPSPATAPSTSQDLPVVVSSNPPHPNDRGTYGWQQTPTTTAARPSGPPDELVQNDKSVDLWPASMAASTLPPAPSLVGSDTRRSEPQSVNSSLADPAAVSVSASRAAGSVAPRQSTRGGTPTQALAVNQKMSKSRRFEFDYDLQDVSPGSVHRVEVWYTADGGRSWRHHGDDEDRQSPYLMQVDEDGLYGIRLLIQTRVGYNVRPPESGEPADIWINVDATPPVARITSVEYGKGSNTGQLQIRWDLHDPNLAEHPVTLLFADSLNGPWRKVVGDYPNVGHYSWQIDDRAPPRIFLRLEARDKAGNIATDSPATPVTNVRTTPRGQILDVRPAARPSTTTVR